MEIEGDCEMCGDTVDLGDCVVDWDRSLVCKGCVAEMQGSGYDSVDDEEF